MSGAYGDKLHISTLYVMPSTATSREEIHKYITFQTSAVHMDVVPRHGYGIYL